MSITIHETIRNLYQKHCNSMPNPSVYFSPCRTVLGILGLILTIWDHVGHLGAPVGHHGVTLLYLLGADSLP